MQEQKIYTKTIRAYNGRRYGRPWAAKIVDFTGSPKLEFIQYCYNGNDQGGEIVMQCEIGEIVKIGQKDHRKSSGSDNDFYVARDNGTLERIDDPVAARKMWSEWQKNRSAE